MHQSAALIEHLRNVPAKYKLVRSLDDDQSVVYKFQHESKEIHVIWVKQVKKDLFSTAVMYVEPAVDRSHQMTLCRLLGSGAAFQSWDEDGAVIDEIYVSSTSFYPRGKLSSVMALILLEGLTWDYLSHPVTVSKEEKKKLPAVMVEIGKTIWIPGVTGPVWPKTIAEAEYMIEAGRVKINGKMIGLDNITVNPESEFYWFQIDDLHLIKILVEQQ